MFQTTSPALEAALRLQSELPVRTVIGAKVKPARRGGREKAHIERKRRARMIELRYRGWTVHRIAEEVGVDSSAVARQLRSAPGYVRYRHARSANIRPAK